MNDSSAEGGAGAALSPWALGCVIPALGRTAALRGYPGGIDGAGPGWSSPAAGDQLAPGPEPASAKAPGTEGGPSAPGGPGTAKTRAGGRSVWQRSLSAWRAAGPEGAPRPGAGGARVAGRGPRGTGPGGGAAGPGRRAAR